MLSRSRPARVLTVILCAVATIVSIGAADQAKEALAVLRSMSVEERNQLEAKLNRFEQVASPEQQKAIRALDERIAAMPEEEGRHYLSVLRRYHNWLGSLPETVRTTLLSRPVSERIAQIASLSNRHTIPPGGPPRWLRLTDGGMVSLLDLAAILKVWREMTPEERREVESPPPGRRRLEMLLRNARGKRALREVHPAGFDEAEWTTKAESGLKEIAPQDPELIDAMAKLKAETSRLKAESGKSKSDIEAAFEKARHNRLRREAIHLYFQEHPPRPVDPGNLLRFRAAMPPWIQAAFDSLPPDEARRRLSTIYRLVYPDGEFKEEVGGKPKPAPVVERGPGPARPSSPPGSSPGRPREPAVPKPSRLSDAPF
jgi:hypothetical protein